MHKSKTHILLGPPGTGKTKESIDHVKMLLSNGVRPEDIAFVSFSKKAAEEGKSRTAAKLQIEENKLRHFKTLHAIAFRELGVRRDGVMGWQHLKELGNRLGLEFRGREVVDDEAYGMNKPDRMLFLVGLAKNRCLPLKKVLDDAGEEDISWPELERLDSALTAYKKSRGVIDFNDMMEQFVSAGMKLVPRIKHLVVDEAQDLSTIQWKMVELLATQAETTLIAGDSLQAIYEWSGADIDRFVGLEGSQRILTKSYRLPKKAHALAKGIAARVQKKRPYEFSPNDEEGQIVWHSSYDDVDLGNGTWLLLARNGYMLEDLEEYCMGQGISFHSIGRDPLKAPSLTAIVTWENLRRGQGLSPDAIKDLVRFVGFAFMSNDFRHRVDTADARRPLTMSDLKSMGLRTDAIWHEALTRIPPKEREFFLNARRRNEPLLKKPRVNISTIHAAKGGEAENVMLLTDYSYRCHKNSEENPDAELRVWYVATTRCQKTLHLVEPRTDLSFKLL